MKAKKRTQTMPWKSRGKREISQVEGSSAVKVTLNRTDCRPRRVQLQQRHLTNLHRASAPQHVPGAVVGLRTQYINGEEKGAATIESSSKELGNKRKRQDEITIQGDAQLKERSVSRLSGRRLPKGGKQN